MSEENEVNNISRSENTFSEICEHGLRRGGVHAVSVKGHGKTRLLFSMARELRQKARVLIFDGSEAWLYGYDRIPTFTVKERDITLLGDLKTTDEIERYQIKNWNLVKFALHTHKDILFRLKTRKPSKRGFFVRQVVNYLDRLQRQSREKTSDNEANQYIAYFIEEAQDCFNSRSTTRLEAEEFLTVFNEARNQKENFWTSSQRLNDFSKTIRTKQTYIFGSIPEEDKSISVRKLERKYDIDFSKVEPRNWVFEGKTFESPTWKQEGKPYIINHEIQKSFVEQLKPIFAPKANTFKAPKLPLLYRILDKLAPKVKVTENPQIEVNKWENDEDREEEEEEDDWDEFLTTEEEWE